MHATHILLSLLPALVWITGVDANAAVDDELVRDVCIVGGGSSGTYAAIRLKELGYSVALVEKEDRLGGHVNTYRDSATGKFFDYGVIAFHNITTVTKYFDSLAVALAPAIPGYGDTSVFVNNIQSDGKIVQKIPSSVQWTNQTAVRLAFAKYLEIVQQGRFLAQGREPPTEMSEDLVLPFGDFLRKHDLGAMSFPVSQFVPGFRNLLTLPTLYVVKAFPADMAKTVLGLAPPFISTVKGNQDIYDRALDRLGDDAFLGTTVHGVLRHGGGIRAHLKSTTGSTVRAIRAKKLLVAIPPEPRNLLRLGLFLTPAEVRLFSQFENTQFWASVLNITGLPAGDAFLDIDLEAPYAIASAPMSYGFIAAPGFDDLYVNYYATAERKSPEEVQRAILQSLDRFVKANGFNITGTPSFVEINSHSPYQLTVSPSLIKNGFYKKLNALQGRENIWWTGGAWHSYDSSLIWNWTEYELLPKIVDSLKETALEDIQEL